ncbi:MAG: SDR family oxidoreductase [Burkholderiales bacterium]|nr:SDR family oxidoreductase [Burkholderiales bacterium]
MNATNDTQAQGRDELAGRVALVTGAAAGIGIASARRMSAAGAAVVLADRDEEGGRAAAAELVAAGRRAHFVRADITRDDEVQALVADTVAHFGALDALFNNAGVNGREIATSEVSLDDFERVLAVNLTGTFRVMKYAIPAMLAGSGGAIVNNASIAGLVGIAHRAAYCASKGGVIQLTRVAALEYASRGIRVNCICPGLVDTAMLSHTKGNPAQAFAKVLVPMGRLATTQEIAELVCFLASDRASYMTGAVVPVDGGYGAR